MSRGVDAAGIVHDVTFMGTGTRLRTLNAWCFACRTWTRIGDDDTKFFTYSQALELRTEAPTTCLECIGA